MRQIREFRSNFENISRDIRESVSRLSRECKLFSFKFVGQSCNIRASDARHSYECRLVLFSRQIVARFSPDCRATVVQHSRDICKFCIVNSPKFRGDKFATLARLSCDGLAKYFGRKKSHKIFQHV